MTYPKHVGADIARCGDQLAADAHALEGMFGAYRWEISGAEPEGAITDPTVLQEALNILVTVETMVPVLRSLLLRQGAMLNHAAAARDAVCTATRDGDCVKGC